jgi:hypothetical protein
VKPTIPEVLPLVREYYAMPGNGVGGSLHIVLEDGNVSDGDLWFCKGWALEHGDEAGYRLAGILLEMSKTQRKKLSCMA